MGRILVSNVALFLVKRQCGSLPIEQLQQFIIVAAFGGFCFGCGYLIAFVVTRNNWRGEMIKRGVARYDWHTGKWEWGEPLKEGQSRH
jgi:hypothetical protein